MFLQGLKWSVTHQNLTNLHGDSEYAIALLAFLNYVHWPTGPLHDPVLVPLPDPFTEPLPDSLPDPLHDPLPDHLPNPLLDNHPDPLPDLDHLDYWKYIFEKQKIHFWKTENMFFIKRKIHFLKNRKLKYFCKKQKIHFLKKRKFVFWKNAEMKNG